MLSPVDAAIPPIRMGGTLIRTHPPAAMNDSTLALRDVLADRTL